MINVYAKTLYDLLDKNGQRWLETIKLSLQKPDHPLVDAMLVLAQMGEHTLIPIFSGNESVGTVTRKRLLPLTTPLLEKVDILMS